jgi:putative transposase
MPWKEQSTVEARNAFIEAYWADELSMTDLCAAYGISRKTGYKWLKRYDEQGRGGLGDRSRAPTTSPLATPDELVDLVLGARKTHPRWGARKLKASLERQYPHLEIPAASTIGVILKRHGLVLPPKREKKTPPYPHSLADYERPNKIWCADFKGSVPLAGGKRCNPLTISDGFSRYLLCCEALLRTDVTAVRPLFEAVFRQFGLPERIRTDNGPPFASRAPGGLSELAIWWMKLGIVHERIQPGKPTQNGRHERIHRTLALEACDLPRRTHREQQRAFDRFRHEYNDLRPHEALGNRTPSDFYQRASKRYPRPLREPQYSPAHEIRIVRSSGEIKWKGKLVFLSETLRSESVGLRCDPEQQGWVIEYGSIHLGVVTWDGELRRPREPRRDRRR